MKETLHNVWTKVVENRATVLRATGVVLGAAIGAVVVGAVINNMSYDVALELEPVDEPTAE